jgi:hypothetical protein
MAEDKAYTIGIIGVRDFKGELYTNQEYVINSLITHVVNNLGRDKRFRIVTGGGKGVESMLVDWCKENQISYRKIPPNIRDFGSQKAFSIRNNHIVSQCDELIVFWDGVVDIVAESLITAMHVNKKTTLFPLT